MKARKGVLEYLQKILTAQLTAVHQYLAHAAMCDDWGYGVLHHEIQESVMEKMHHAQELIKHILYLEGKPDLQSLSKLNIGRTVPEQFKNDVKLETEDLTLLRSAIEHCAKVGDFTTRHLLERMSAETDEHIDWLETQQTTIAQVGLEKYLSEQIKK
jgi:bacterioferritin